MTYDAHPDEIAELYQELQELRDRMREIRRSMPPQPVEDYVFVTGHGEEVQLSELFGDNDDLMVVHNMGKSCPYCTLWADGLNGIYDHLADRTAFVVSSPNKHEVMNDFAKGRDWKFPMLSYHGTSFAEDMGYQEEDRFAPGISVFQRRDGQLFRVANDMFGPGDDYCALWNLLELIPEGADGWQPKFSYD